MLIGTSEQACRSKFCKQRPKMQPNKNWKFLLLWTSLACNPSWYCITVDAAAATSLTQPGNKTRIPPKILFSNVNWATYRPLTKTEPGLGKFPSPTLELQKDTFDEGIKVSAGNLQVNPNEPLGLHSQAVPNLKLIQPQYLQQPNTIEKLPTVIQDLRTENLKPRSELAPLKKGGIYKAPFLRGLGDLFCVSPIIAVEVNTPPPRDNSQNNAQKQNEPPQLEGQPNDFPAPTPAQIEQRLEDPQADYAKRLERLLQILKEKKQASNNLTDEELGTIIAKPESPTEELEGLIVKPVEQQPPAKTATVSQPPALKPVGYLFGRVSYFQTNNLFSSDIDPIQDGLIFSGITLASAPLPLGSKTYLSGSIDGNIIRYINQGEFNYNQFRLNLDLYHQLTQRMYGEIGWSNQQLFYAKNSDRYQFAAGDRFLDENSFHLSLGRRDQLTPKLMLDSYYEFRFNLPEAPQKRDRINNSLWVSLSYYLLQSLNVGLDYQFNLSNFTKRDRQDFYHRLFSHLNYRVSDISSVSLQGGVTVGDSTDNTINFDGWFFSLNYNWELGRF